MALKLIDIGIKQHRESGFLKLEFFLGNSGSTPDWVIPQKKGHKRPPKNELYFKDSYFFVVSATTQPYLNPQNCNSMSTQANSHL